jgi:hypothetical protein
LDVTERFINDFAERSARLERRAADPATNAERAERLYRAAERFNRAVAYGWRRIARGV